MSAIWELPTWVTFCTDFALGFVFVLFLTVCKVGTWYAYQISSLNLRYLYACPKDPNITAWYFIYLFIYLFIYSSIHINYKKIKTFNVRTHFTLGLLSDYLYLHFLADACLIVTKWVTGHRQLFKPASIYKTRRRFKLARMLSLPNVQFVKHRLTFIQC